MKIKTPNIASGLWGGDWELVNIFWMPTNNYAKAVPSHEPEWNSEHFQCQIQVTGRFFCPEDQNRELAVLNGKLPSVLALCMLLSGLGIKLFT